MADRCPTCNGGGGWSDGHHWRKCPLCTALSPYTYTVSSKTVVFDPQREIADIKKRLTELERNTRGS